MEKTPKEIAEEILKLADNYGKLGERYNEIKKIYAVWWEGFRKDYKSDTSAERAWDLTVEGIEMSEIHLKMKTTEKRMSALKSYLRVLESESFNQY